MTPAAAARDAAAAAGDRWRGWRIAGHVVAAALVVAGVLAVLVRPTAPSVDAAAATTWFGEDFLALADRYRAPWEAVGLVAVAVRVGFALALAASPPGRRVVGAAARRFGHRPWLAAALVAGGAVVVLDLLLSPIAFWGGYLHDGAFGLRTQGLGGWMTDWVTARAPEWLAAAGMAGGGYALAGRCRRGWPPLAAVIGALLVAATVAVSPVVLEPLRHETTPLAAGPVRAAVVNLAADAGVGLADVRVADASRRTRRENAYVSGLGATRRVVLYDTLLASREPDEIRAVVAHEIAHHEHRDLERGVLAGAAAVVVAVYALAAWLRRRDRRGRQRGVTDPRAIGAVVAAVLIASVLATPVEHALSRRAEAAADWRALELTGDPQGYEQLKVSLAVANLSDPDPPGWYHLWWSSHPRTVQRLTLAEHWRANAAE